MEACRAMLKVSTIQIFQECLSMAKKQNVEINSPFCCPNGVKCDLYHFLKRIRYFKFSFKKNAEEFLVIGNIFDNALLNMLC